MRSRNRIVIVYNEIEPYAAEWLENLSNAGHIARGTVDRRSIRELDADDVRGATQFHAFAGIGAWSYALRLAGWPDDAPVWTGSCPCQPFSVAGQRRGVNDDRHFWPEWFRLIRKCRPPIVFGEQVAGRAGIEWLDAVLADLESVGYAVGAADLCAAGVGAPHRRQRLFFVAHRAVEQSAREQVGIPRFAWEPRGAVAHTESAGRAEGGDAQQAGRQDHGAGPVDDRGMVDANIARSQGRIVGWDGTDEWIARTSGVGGAWDDAEWIECRDGKTRPAQPGSFPLAHGATARVGRLRAYGNAIVPQVAATFIRCAVSAVAEVCS